MTFEREWASRSAAANRRFVDKAVVIAREVEVTLGHESMTYPRNTLQRARDALADRLFAILAATRYASTTYYTVDRLPMAILSDEYGDDADTLAEDTDIAMALCRAGWRVVYRSDAHASTHVPTTVRGLWHQRHRWAYGTLQSIWKHRRAVKETGTAGRLGRRTLPYLVLFQLALPLAAPLMDVVALYGLASGTTPPRPWPGAPSASPNSPSPPTPCTGTAKACATCGSSRSSRPPTAPPCAWSPPTPWPPPHWAPDPDGTTGPPLRRSPNRSRQRCDGAPPAAGWQQRQPGAAVWC
ncbi:glycosyltransferase [Streptomyces sp. CBMA123]|uniref:glycosyltransferase n=1 Tax=Streptomyces sp. CBMA123 TaxID=1896313 RepID=UPI001661C1CA|nr:glycosyltransferase family 2 protein [Streptomyces sp. CBMA123]MBD0689017.1 hypothetical protein [Streptomyces sp. CBMA123]